VGNITGVGLGLVIIQRCLSLHGGQLNFKSQIGEGTTVTVRIPQERIP
jgi:signal transduction histidine kinase